MVLRPQHASYEVETDMSEIMLFVVNYNIQITIYESVIIVLLIKYNSGDILGKVSWLFI